MTRRVFAPAIAVVCSICFVTAAFAQAKPAVPTTPAPVTPAKWIPPVKGDATVEVLKGKTRRVGNEIVSTLKVRNTSKGAIALLIVEEFWYNQKRDIVSGDTYRHRTLINPGDIVDVTTRSPSKPDLYTNLYTFRHANGKVTAKEVKAFK